MIDAAQSDWFVQSAMIVATLAFVLIMRLVFKSEKEVAILLMQGLLAVSSIVVIAVAFDARVFSSLVNQRFIMIVPAMMTLIYLGRDVFNSLPGRHHDDE